MADDPPPSSPPSPASPALTRARPRPGRRIAAWLLGGLAVGTAALVGTGAWLSRSEPGSAWLLQQVPGLHVEGLRGALLGDELSADLLRYEFDGHRLELHHVRLAGLTGSWTTRPAPGQPWVRLQLTRLSADQATWRSGPPSASPTTALTDLHLPVALDVAAAHIGQLQADTAPVLRDIDARFALGDADGSRHTVHALRFRTEKWGAELQGAIAAGGDLEVQLQAQARSADNAAMPWQASAKLNGPLARLRADAHLASGTGQGPALDAEATVTPFAAWPLASLNLRTQGLDLSALHGDAPRTRLRGEAHIRSTGLDQPADVEATLFNDEAGRWDEGQLPLKRLHVVARGQPQALGDLQLQTLELDLGSDTTGGQLRGSGALQPAGGAERLQLKLLLDGLRPSALDQRLPAMTLAGPLTLEIDGLPAIDSPAADAPAQAPAPAASGTRAPAAKHTPELAARAAAPASAAASHNGSIGRWHAQLDAQLEGRVDSRPTAPRAGARPPTAAGRKAAPAPTAPAPAATAVASASGPAVQLTLQAALDRGRLTLTQALARAGDAQATLQGELTLGDSATPWAWQARGELARFDPLLWWPGSTPAAPRGANQLNATLSSDGRWQAPARSGASPVDGLVGQLSVALLPSQWAGMPLQGDINASRTAQGVAQLKAQVDGGGNRVSAQAQDGGGAPRHLDVAIDAPALSSLAPWLASLGARDPAAWLPRQGAVQARAEAQWPVGQSDAQWRGKLRGSKLVHPSWHADRIDADVQGLGLGDGPLSGTLSGDGMAWQQAQIQTLRAEIKGSLSEHQFSLQVLSPVRPPAWVEQVLNARTGSGTRLQLGASGRWQPATPGEPVWRAGRWSGKLDELQGRASDGSGQPWLAAKDLGLGIAWDDDGHLTEAYADPGRVALPGTALQWTEARFRAGSGEAPGTLALTAKLEAFELAPLLARAQPELGWKGDLVLGGDIRLQASDWVDADVVFERLRGDLSVADDVRDTSTVHRALGLSDLRLGMAAHDGIWHFTLGLAGQQLGEMAGVATARTTPQSRWPGPEAPLDGVFQLHVSKLSAWGAWVPPGWRLGGDLQSAATLGGRWGAPEFSGRLTGRQLEVRNGLQGVQFTNGKVDINLKGDRATIEQFEWQGGDGTLRVSGDATLGRRPEADLQIKADSLRLLGRVDRRIVATGEAALALRPNLARLNGRLKIDEGLIDFSRGGAPALDDDVRVVGRAASEPAPGAPAPVDASAPATAPAGTDFENQLDLALDLGPSLRIKGRGLDTLLRGTLQLSNPGKQFAVRGDVRTERGTYRAYNQKLEIERGLLAFTAPLDDPRLDILAIRPNLDVKVGVAVTGTALNPRVRLASDPEMSDTDKLSWLVLGRAPDGLGRADSALLQRAAMALLAGEGEGPTDAFLANIGLSDFGVRQQGEGSEQTTVVSVGKQLTRRWYVGYERSVNATTGTWQLIYRIAQRFTLRAQSGEDSALDLIWSWRWN
ncbi:translocation/assembly module TamB domain-containing protein [Ideonella sp. DXS29W]|uniref:Translocation/assembly module TamB domain-containing protein n=1 Tax=Ideonella lacteola TaxID=2984193 RepID=A0ABU9BKI7_9BURK